MNTGQEPNRWDEDTSRMYLDYGRYFVPAREAQMRMMVSLLRGEGGHISVLEVGCGEGLLAEMVLDELPQSIYTGLDGSELMLKKARERLGRFGERARLGRFELADRSWRNMEAPVSAVISSLVIHHLDGNAKRVLYGDVFVMLTPGGVFIIADMVEPATTAGRQVAAQAWDEVVRERALEQDGNLDGLAFFESERWNTYRYPGTDDIDHPSGLFEQLKWLDEAGFSGIEVHYLRAGHALFSGWKRGGTE